MLRSGICVRLQRVHVLASQRRAARIAGLRVSAAKCGFRIPTAANRLRVPTAEGRLRVSRGARQRCVRRVRDHATARVVVGTGIRRTRVASGGVRCVIQWVGELRCTYVVQTHSAMQCRKKRIKPAARVLNVLKLAARRFLLYTTANTIAAATTPAATSTPTMIGVDEVEPDEVESETASHPSSNTYIFSTASNYQQTTRHLARRTGSASGTRKTNSIRGLKQRVSSKN